MTSQRPPRSLLVRCAATAAAVCGLATTTAVAVLATGRSDDARSLLGFDFSGVRPSLRAATSITAHNAALAGGVLTCATALPHVSRRLVVDVLLATILAVNAAAVGLSVGAYGGRAFIALVPHALLELAAFSLAGGAYMQARKQAFTARSLALIAAVCAVLLATGAFLETYVRLGGSR